MSFVLRPLLITDTEVPTYFENYDLKSIVTPVDVDRLEFLLKNTGYNPKKTHALVDGFKFGFDIRYRGDPEVRLEIKSCFGIKS